MDYLGKTRDKPFSALPPERICKASPKAISGRTSYYQARLAFHSLPQLIPEYCSAHGFGPPPAFRLNSPWPWQARLASGLRHTVKNALLTLAFAMLSPGTGLNYCIPKLVGSFCKKHAIIPINRDSDSLWT